MTTAHLVVGPPRHGVVQFGCDLHDAMLAVGGGSTLWRADRHDQLTWETTPSTLHLQFTDRLFGPSPAAAAEAVAAIVTRADRSGRRVTATLHDLPQPSDGHNVTRRKQAYAAVCASVHGVVVSSEHERRLLGPYAPARVAVVPLPVLTVTAPKAPDPDANSVGIFGFVYPGKGHLEAVAAMTGLGADLVAIGEVSTGHDDLLAEIHTRADDLGVHFRLTGYVTDGLSDILRGVTVPLAPHRHVSASGSLNSWLSVGRRPLAPANRYSEEMEHRNPGSLELYPDSAVGLRTALTRALDNPALTWLPESYVCSPTAAEAARQYIRILHEWHR